MGGGLQSVRLWQQRQSEGSDGLTPALRAQALLRWYLAHCSQSTFFFLCGSVSVWCVPELDLDVPHWWGTRGNARAFYAPTGLDWERARPHLGENATSSHLSLDHHDWGIPPRLCPPFTSEKKGNDALVRVVLVWQAGRCER